MSFWLGSNPSRCFFKVFIQTLDFPKPKHKGLAVGSQGVIFGGSADIVQQVPRDVRGAFEPNPHLEMGFSAQLN